MVARGRNFFFLPNGITNFSWSEIENIHEFHKKQSHFYWACCANNTVLICFHVRHVRWALALRRLHGHRKCCHAIIDLCETTALLLHVTAYEDMMYHSVVIKNHSYQSPQDFAASFIKNSSGSCNIFSHFVTRKLPEQVNIVKSCVYFSLSFF